MKKDTHDQTYRIRRFYQRPDEPPETVREGLTLAEAQAHCEDPETSSTTCKSAEGKRRTAEHGPWFDGYDLERN